MLVRFPVGYCHCF
uniref:Uncharacterized protein n=1 Tax=Anguilla anguilla TaxID=7936 RepID=A0A0E9PM73_ANGAN